MLSMPRFPQAAARVRQPYGQAHSLLARLRWPAVALVSALIVITDVLGLPGRIGAPLVLICMAALAGVQADRLMYASAPVHPDLRVHR